MPDLPEPPPGAAAGGDDNDPPAPRPATPQAPAGDPATPAAGATPRTPPVVPDSEDAAEAATDAVVFPQAKEVAMALLIMSMGAFGGWFVGAVPMDGLPPSNLNWWQRLLVGGIAGGIMVYYVAKTDRRRFWHCIFFAFLSGMIGQPLIVNTLKSLMPAAVPTVSSTTDALQQSSSAVAVAVGQQSAEQTKAGLQQVEDSAQKVIGAASAAKNPDDKARATEALTKTMDSLAVSLPQAPGLAQADMVTTLKNLVMKTYTNLDQKSALKAFEAIRPLADQDTKNPQVQSVAESAKNQLAVMLGITPEVVIEAEAGSNPEALGKLKQALVDAGYSVPSVENGGTARGAEAKLIYYTSGDEVDARNIVEILKKTNLSDPSAALSTSASPARPRHYELQVGREALANLHNAPAK